LQLIVAGKPVTEPPCVGKFDLASLFALKLYLDDLPKDWFAANSRNRL